MPWHDNVIWVHGTVESLQRSPKDTEVGLLGRVKNLKLPDGGTQEAGGRPSVWGRFG